MQAYLPEIEWLVVGVAAEEQAQIVGGIRRKFRRFLLGDKTDIRILRLENFRHSRFHYAGNIATVLPLKTFHEREPCDGVAQRADRKLNQNLFPVQVEIVREYRLIQFSFPIDFQPETDVEFFHRLDRASGLHVHGIQQAVRVQILEYTAVFTFFREFHPESVVEIEANAVNGFQNRIGRRQHKSRLLGWLVGNQKRSFRQWVTFDGKIIHIQ